MWFQDVIKTGLIFSLLMLTGCDWFNTREPEEPGGGMNIWTPPVSPRGALDNLTTAYNLHNVDYYMKSFAKPGYAQYEFIFYPDISSGGADTSVFSGWSYDAEYSFISKLFSPDFLPIDSTASLQFTAESEPPGEDMPLYRESYALTVGHTSADLPHQYSGKSEIQFDRDNSGYWVIISWRDEKSGDAPTLTELKSSISN
jgi:hypothetical protein